MARPLAESGGVMAPLKAESEAAFQQKVEQFAAYMGWRLQHHTHDSRRSNKGWPDLVLCRPPEILFIELKGDKTRVTNEQAEWLAALRACGLEAQLWRPSDWPEVQARLQRESTADLGVCPACESVAVSESTVAGVLSCGVCRATWSGVRRRLAA